MTEGAVPPILPGEGQGRDPADAKTRMAGTEPGHDARKGRRTQFVQVMATGCSLEPRDAFCTPFASSSATIWRKEAALT